MALITCPDCGSQVSDQALACPKCGRPSPPLPLAPLPQPSAKAKKQTGCGMALAVVVVGGVILTILAVVMMAIFDNGSSGGRISSSNRAGVERHLRTGASSPSVPVFRSEAVLSEIRAAHTDRAIAAAIMGGDGFLVDQGTRALIVQGGSDSNEVRILEGEMVGSTGFVPSEWCKE